MNYLTSKQFSEIWGISERRIIKLCKENRINGAVKNGMIWNIPENAIKPSDKRNKIFKYLNIPKRVMIISLNNEIVYELIPLLKKQGYIIDCLCNNSFENNSNINVWEIDKNINSKQNDFLDNISKYYNGLIIIEDNNQKIKNKEDFIKKFSRKMDCESSIVLLTDYENNHLDELSIELINTIGIRINTLYLEKESSNCILDLSQIAEDIMILLTQFKNTTGVQIKTNGGCIPFEKNGRTKNLEAGVYYRYLTYYLKNLNKESYMWCASIMLEDEWTEEHQEMTFRINNLDAVNRGAKMDRIFIFSKSKIKEFKGNKTLNIFMQSNINTMFVDYDEVKIKEPELLKIVGDGWDGINKDTLLVDLPEGEEQRGYISVNKKEVEQAYNCFQRLKTYAKDLKEILK